MAFNDERQAIIDGLVSAQSEATGWNAVRSGIAVTAVVRTSDTVVTITLPALATYDITAPESITCTVPDSALVGTAVAATPTMQINQHQAVSGAHRASTRQLFAGSVSGTGFDSVRQEIINGLVSGQSEANGWNNTRSGIPVTAVVRTSDTAVTITLPALASYDITAEETIACTVPDVALAGAALAASPSIGISAAGATPRKSVMLMGVG